MAYKFYFFIALSSFVLSCSAQNNRVVKGIDFGDSLAVANFIKRSSLCEQVQLASDSLDAIVNERGYSILIIGSISKQTKENVLIPISKGNVTLSKDYQKYDLKEQIDKIGLRFCANK
ncbi:MAG: hypothetical protein WDO16_02130 [Bacteroidota bacterium]